MANTVKVRIAVAVDEIRCMRAYILGKYEGETEETVWQEAMAWAGPRGRVFWIEAELPIPEIQTIQAKVSE